MKTTKLILVFVIFSALFIIAAPHAHAAFFFSDPFNINVAKQSADATVQIIVSRILGGILTFVGVLSFVVFVYSGLLWMIGGATSNGESNIEKAKKMMMWAIIGLVISFSSFVILREVFQNLTTSLDIDVPEDKKTE